MVTEYICINKQYFEFRDFLVFVLKHMLPIAMKFLCLPVDYVHTVDEILNNSYRLQ